MMAKKQRKTAKRTRRTFTREFKQQAEGETMSCVPFCFLLLFPRDSIAFTCVARLEKICFVRSFKFQYRDSGSGVFSVHSMYGCLALVSYHLPGLESLHTWLSQRGEVIADFLAVSMSQTLFDLYGKCIAGNRKTGMGIATI